MIVDGAQPLLAGELDDDLLPPRQSALQHRRQHLFEWPRLEMEEQDFGHQEPLRDNGLSGEAAKPIQAS